MSNMVETIKTGRREPKGHDEVPVRLRLTPVDDWLFDWKIWHSSRVDWVEPLEAKLPPRFPRSFRSLV